MVPPYIFYALLSAFFAALVAILGKKGLGGLEGVDSTLATTVRSIIMAFFLIGVSFSFGKFKFLEQIHIRSLIFIALSGIAGALSWLSYFLAIKIAPADALPSISALDRLSVVFVLALTIIFFGEKLTLYSLTGAVLVTFGAILMTIK